MKIIYSLIIALMLVSCSHPRTITWLEPKSDDFIMEDGYQVIEDSSRGCKIKLKYLSMGPGECYFNLIFKNCTDSSIKVDPQQFHYIILEKTKKLYMKGIDTVYASDPNTLVKDIDNKIDAQQAGCMISSCCLGAGVLFEIFSSKGKADVSNSVDNFVDNAHGFSERMDALRADRDYILSHMLLKKEVKPNETFFGDIVFPIDTSFSEAKVCIPLGKARFSYNYIRRTRVEK